MAWQFPISTAATQGPAVDLQNGDDVIVGQYVTLTAANSNAIGGLGSGHEVRLYGTVLSTGIGIILGDFNTRSDNKVLITSTGYVESTQSFAISVAGSRGYVENHGTIRSDGWSGIELRVGSDPSTTSTIINTGIIESNGTNSEHLVGAIQRSESGETISLINTGTIKGALWSYSSYAQNFVFGDIIYDGVDLITNRGTMIGDIRLETGDDLYDGRLGTIQGDVFGGGGADRLYAGVGNNRLFGQDGNDTLMGGAGADYLSGGTGTDRASYASATQAVTVSLANPSINAGDAKGDTYNSIENLSGSNHNDNLFGNNANNAINGGAGNDVIKGYAGNDTLTGYTGQDVFVFNSALNASTNVDKITDFNAADDTIHVDNAFFIGLAAGALAASAFKDVAVAAKDADDRILYNSDTGSLFYDRDGSGGTYAAIKFASLTGSPTLTAADFVVI